MKTRVCFLPQMKLYLLSTFLTVVVFEGGQSRGSGTEGILVFWIRDSVGFTTRNWRVKACERRREEGEQEAERRAFPSFFWLIYSILTDENHDTQRENESSSV